MAASQSLRKMKTPRKPKLKAAKSAFDNYEKRKREVDAHNKRVDAEINRRKKILSK